MYFPKIFCCSVTEMELKWFKCRLLVILPCQKVTRFQHNRYQKESKTMRFPTSTASPPLSFWTINRHYHSSIQQTIDSVELFRVIIAHIIRIISQSSKAFLLSSMKFCKNECSSLCRLSFPWFQQQTFKQKVCTIILV